MNVFHKVHNRLRERNIIVLLYVVVHATGVLRFLSAAAVASG